MTSFTKAFGALTLAALVTAAFVPAPQARVAIGSGDSCTATGSGTSYSLHVDVASTNPEQYGFAIGGSGGRVRDIDIPGAQGTLFTQDLPAGASGSWISPSRLEPGPVLVTVKTTGAVSSFSVRPASAPNPPAYFDPIVCAVKAPAAAPSGRFSIASHAVYDAASKAWKLDVTVSGAGRISATQPEPTVGTAYPTSSTAKPLVQARGVAVNAARTVTLKLRATSLGESTLASKGSLKLKLLVTFFPTGGKAVNKSVSLVLTR